MPAMNININAAFSGFAPLCGFFEIYIINAINNKVDSSPAVTI